MNARQIIAAVELARTQGVAVAIETPREGFWVSDRDKFEVRDSAVYWEHDNGRTYLIPASLVWLQFRSREPRLDVDFGSIDPVIR